MYSSEMVVIQAPCIWHQASENLEQVVRLPVYVGESAKRVWCVVPVDQAMRCLTSYVLSYAHGHCGSLT